MFVAGAMLAGRLVGNGCVISQEKSLVLANLAGIRNTGAAWDTFTIAPTVAGDLTGVEATVGTLRGPIKVEWRADHRRCGVGTESDDKSVRPAVISCSGRGVIKNVTFE